MNRILFLLGLMLSGLLVSCSPDAPRYTIGVSQCSDDTWRHKMNDEIQREALFYGGVKVETRTAHDDSRRQIEDIRYFIRQKVDLLIVAANEGMALTPVVEEAFDKGIPVIMARKSSRTERTCRFYSRYRAPSGVYECHQPISGHDLACQRRCRMAATTCRGKDGLPFATFSGDRCRIWNE